MLQSKKQFHLGLPPIFKSLNQTAYARLADSAVISTVKKNERVYSAGDQSTPFVAVRSGLLITSFPSHDGDAPAVGMFLQPGDVFAASTCVGSIAPTTLQAVAASSVIQWPLEAFRAAMKDDMSLGAWYVDLVERRLAAEQYMRAKVSRLSKESQYAYLLWSLSEATKDGKRLLKAKIPQAIVASFINIGREEVSRKKQMLQGTGHLVPTDDGLELQPSLANMFMLEDPTIPLPGASAFADSLWPDS